MGILVGTGGFSPEQRAEAEPSDSERGTKTEAEPSGSDYILFGAEASDSVRERRQI